MSMYSLWIDGYEICTYTVPWPRGSGTCPGTLLCYLLAANIAVQSDSSNTIHLTMRPQDEV